MPIISSDLKIQFSGDGGRTWQEAPTPVAGTISDFYVKVKPEDMPDGELSFPSHLELEIEVRWENRIEARGFWNLFVLAESGKRCHLRYKVLLILWIALVAILSR